MNWQSIVTQPRNKNGTNLCYNLIFLFSSIFYLLQLGFYLQFGFLFLLSSFFLFYFPEPDQMTSASARILSMRTIRPVSPICLHCLQCSNVSSSSSSHSGHSLSISFGQNFLAFSVEPHLALANIFCSPFLHLSLKYFGVRYLYLLLYLVFFIRIQCVACRSKLDV